MAAHGFIRHADLARQLPDADRLAMGRDQLTMDEGQEDRSIGDVLLQPGQGIEGTKIILGRDPGDRTHLALRRGHHRICGSGPVHGQTLTQGSVAQFGWPAGSFWALTGFYSWLQAEYPGVGSSL